MNPEKDLLGGGLRMQRLHPIVELGKGLSERRHYGSEAPLVLRVLPARVMSTAGFVGEQGD